MCVCVCGGGGKGYVAPPPSNYWEGPGPLPHPPPLFLRLCHNLSIIVDTNILVNIIKQVRDRAWFVRLYGEIIPKL